MIWTSWRIFMRPRLFVRAAILLGALLAVSSSGVFAAIVFMDDFNKTPNQPLIGTTPNIGGTWAITGTSVVNPIQIVSNQVPLTNNGQDVNAALTSEAPNAGGFALHTSADINVIAAQATGDYFLHVSDPAGSSANFYQRLGASATTGGYFLQFAVTSGTGATTTPGTTVLTLGQTYHVDVNWNFVAGTLNDTFQVLVDGVPYLSKTWDSATAEPPGIGSVNFRQGSATVAPTVTVDNLAVEFVPEPASVSLLLFAGLFGLIKIRTR
jgi:hypothetical protein